MEFLARLICKVKVALVQVCVMENLVFFSASHSTVLANRPELVSFFVYILKAPSITASLSLNCFIFSDFSCQTSVSVFFAFSLLVSERKLFLVTAYRH